MDAVNVVDSFTKAKYLYKELCKRCHPDLFIEEENKIRAENLFKRIQECRYDYSALEKIKKELDDFSRA